MTDVLANPSFHAMSSGNKSLSNGTALVKYFDAEVSPFVGISTGYSTGFDDLHEMLPQGRRVVHAHPSPIPLPPGWKLLAYMKGLQFVYKGPVVHSSFPDIRALGVEHVDSMVALASLTNPGPFSKRTIEFGNYHGIFSNDVLVAMAGQRIHPFANIEISAVCTHPDHTGNGYARMLIEHLLMLIQKQDCQPFLHVRHDNERAVELYKRLGFVLSRRMNFYFLERV